MGNNHWQYLLNILRCIDYSISNFIDYETASKMIGSRCNSADDWRKEWADFSAPNRKLVPDPNGGVLGMNLPRSTWSASNRLRPGHGPFYTNGGSKTTQSATVPTEIKP